MMTAPQLALTSISSHIVAAAVAAKISEGEVSVDTAITPTASQLRRARLVLTNPPAPATVPLALAPGPIDRTWIGREIPVKLDVTTDEYHTATLVRLHFNGEIDIEFDDGAWWDNAPQSIIRLEPTVDSRESPLSPRI